MTPAERDALSRLLETHVPLDEVEAQHLKHVVAVAARHDDPFDRRVIEGHLTGSAFVLDPAGRVLLTHHLRLGIWVQLGGHADGERAAPDIAMREAREESGLTDLVFDPALLFDDGSPRLLDVDVHRIPARRDEPAHDHLDLRFLLRTLTPDRIVADPRETRALEWVTIDDARERCDPGMLRALSRIDCGARSSP